MCKIIKRLYTLIVKRNCNACVTTYDLCRRRATDRSGAFQAGVFGATLGVFTYTWWSGPGTLVPTFSTLIGGTITNAFSTLTNFHFCCEDFHACMQANNCGGGDCSSCPIPFGG